MLLTREFNFSTNPVHSVEKITGCELSGDKVVKARVKHFIDPVPLGGWKTTLLRIKG